MKWLLSLPLILCLSLPCHAQLATEEGGSLAPDNTIVSIAKFIGDMPLKQAVAWSLVDNEIEYLTTLTLAHKWNLGFGVGYSTRDKVVLALSYNFFRLSDIIDTPIFEYVNPELMVYYGASRINDLSGGEDYGLALSLVQLSF